MVGDRVQLQLERSALRWMLPKDERDSYDAASDAAGIARSHAPWAVLPHAEVVMEEVVPQLRKLAADLDSVPDPPLT